MNNQNKSVKINFCECFVIKIKFFFIIYLTFVNLSLLHGQQSNGIITEFSYFDNYKRFAGRPFSLHVDLVTENLQPVSTGLIYVSSGLIRELNQEYLEYLKDSIGEWNGAVCYFPKSIWNNTAEKIKYSRDNRNWIDLDCNLNGEFLSSNYTFNCIEYNELHEIQGVWYFYSDDYRDRFGIWWDGDDMAKSKMYYIKLK